MSEDLIPNVEQQMQTAVAAVRQRLSKLRTGKASPALLDGIRVDYYGTPTPLNQLATIAVPEARLLTLKPFDRGAIRDIERAIQSSNLGLNPTSDGMMIRIPIPELTEERRREFAKLAREIGEEGKVAVRRARQEANDRLKKLEREGGVSEDDLRLKKTRVQELTDEFVEKVDEVVKAKEKDIMEI